MSGNPNYLGITGPAEDLYLAYMHRPVQMLPDPEGLPFHVQGHPIYFDQPHISQEDVQQATTDKPVNPLPFHHFVGVGIAGNPPKQINQPDFISINEDIYLQ